MDFATLMALFGGAKTAAPLSMGPFQENQMGPMPMPEPVSSITKSSSGLGLMSMMSGQQDKQEGMLKPPSAVDPKGVAGKPTSLSAIASTQQQQNPYARRHPMQGLMQFLGR